GYAIYMSLFRWRIRKGRFVGLDNYVDVVGDGWGVFAFFGGLLLIMVAHWLWTDAFRRDDNGAATIGKLLGALVLLGSGVAIGLGWGMMRASGEARFLNGLERTVYYGFGSVPVQIILALVIATLLFQKIRGQEAYRMLYFLPYVTPAVAGGAVFRNIFSPRPERPANAVLDMLGLPTQQWLFETKPVSQIMFGGVLERFGVTDFSGFWAGPFLSLVTIIYFGIWTSPGYNAVIFRAGLCNIPKVMYEAAAIDGATRVKQFRYITVQMLSAVTFYL